MSDQYRTYLENIYGSGSSRTPMYGSRQQYNEGTARANASRNGLDRASSSASNRTVEIPRSFAPPGYSSRAEPSGRYGAPTRMGSPPRRSAASRYGDAGGHSYGATSRREADTGYGASTRRESAGDYGGASSYGAAARRDATAQSRGGIYDDGPLGLAGGSTRDGRSGGAFRGLCPGFGSSRDAYGQGASSRQGGYGSQAQSYAAQVRAAGQAAGYAAGYGQRCGSGFSGGYNSYGGGYGGYGGGYGGYGGGYY